MSASNFDAQRVTREVRDRPRQATAYIDHHALLMLLHEKLNIPDNAHVVHVETTMYPMALKVVVECPDFPQRSWQSEPPLAFTHVQVDTEDVGDVEWSTVTYEVQWPTRKDDDV